MLCQFFFYAWKQVKTDFSMNQPVPWNVTKKFRTLLKRKEDLHVGKKIETFMNFLIFQDSQHKCTHTHDMSFLEVCPRCFQFAHANLSAVFRLAPLALVSTSSWCMRVVCGNSRCSWLRKKWKQSAAIRRHACWRIR